MDQRRRYVIIPDFVISLCVIMLAQIEIVSGDNPPVEPSIQIKEVCFAGANYHQMKSDDGSTTYSAPHWVDTNDDGQATTNTGTGEKNYPVAFTRATTPQVGATFKVTGLPSGQSLRIKATSAMGLSIPPTPIIPAEDGIATLPITTSNGQLADVIQFYNAPDVTAFVINWQKSVSNADWTSIGSTKHTVFLTLAAPLATLKNGKGCRETLLWLACANAKGDTGADQNALLIKIFRGGGSFHDRNIRRFSHVTGQSVGGVLTFWVPGPGGYPLDYGNGVCGNWADFLIDVLAVHAIAAEKIGLTIDPMSWALPGGGSKLPAAVGESGSGFAKWAVPGAVLTHDIYNNYWWDPGVSTNKGQGNTCGTMEWNEHSIVRANGKLLDPSYGVGPYTDPAIYENEAVQGYYCEKIIKAGEADKTPYGWERNRVPPDAALITYPP
jgi:hypothetical protein